MQGKKYISKLIYKDLIDKTKETISVVKDVILLDSINKSYYNPNTFYKIIVK
jgi:hypothetical protein